MPLFALIRFTFADTVPKLDKQMVASEATRVIKAYLLDVKNDFSFDYSRAR